MKNSIVTTPNPILSKPTEKVVEFNDDLKNVATTMLATLRENKDSGIGLAANQLGINKNLFVVEFNDPEKKDTIPLQFFVNPEIVEKSDDIEIMEEGCLSVPNIFLPVERSKKIKVRAQNLEGKYFRLTANDLFARLILHESEHLAGKIFTEHVRSKFLSDIPDVRKLKIVYFGSGEFSYIIYRGLLLIGMNLTLTITDNQKTPVALSAERFNKKHIITDNIQNNYDEIASIKPDLIILADFGQKIPEDILKLPRIAAVNLHPSLLPKYRGSTPIQSAILNGDDNTGVTMMKMASKIDAGKIIAHRTLEIKPDDDANILRIKLANIALRLIMESMQNLISGNFEETVQNSAKATYTHKFSRADGEIDWKKKPEEIDRQIRAFYPWPGTFTFIKNKRLIIHEAHLKEGKLVIDIVQMEGKKPMIFSDFLKGFRGEKPIWFSEIKLENINNLR